jgi:O-antigen/teichoic acid export membrane protein
MVGRTRWLWVPTLLAAVTNVTLNVFLVPRFGVMAAAADTAIAYAVLLCGLVIARSRIVGPRIDYESSRMAAGVLVLLALAVIGVVGFPALDNVSSIVARFLLVVLGGAVVAVFAYLSNRASNTAGATTLEDDVPIVDAASGAERGLEAPYA